MTCAHAMELVGRLLALAALLASVAAPTTVSANGIGHSLAFACEGQTTKVTLRCTSGGYQPFCMPRSQITLYACSGCTQKSWSAPLTLQVTQAFTCADAGVHSCTQIEEGTLDVPCDDLAGFDMLCAEHPECRPMDMVEPGDVLYGCELLPWSTLTQVPVDCGNGADGGGGGGGGSGCNLSATQAGIGVAFALLLGLGLVMARRRR